MKFDLKNIFIGILIGIISTIAFALLLNDVSIDIRVGENINEVDKE